MSPALAALLAALVAASVVALRWRTRRRRRYARIRLIPGRTDEATPEEVQRLLEVLHQLLLARWWQRLLAGQPSCALELWSRATDAGAEARLALVLPDRPALLAAVRGRLLATYRDLLLAPWEPWPAPGPALVRLKKRAPFIRRLRTPEAYEPPLVDAVLAAMGEIAEPAIVQLALTPAPALFDRVSRRRFRAEENRRERARSRGGDPGLHSEVVAAELEGGLLVQHRPLYFADLRVAASTPTAAQLVARTLRGESAQENRLVERTMRARARLYHRRLAAGTANPLPGLARGVLSTPELAGLWQLPSPFMDVVRVRRNPVPRVPAPPAVRRVGDERHALARDAHGLVALHDGDKYANLALLGRPGAGKTAAMLRSALADAEDPECALIVLDPKHELADALLGHLPAAGKRVHVISLADGEAGLDPFHVPGGSPHTIAAGIVAGLKAVTEDSQGAHQIGFSSDRYLRQGAIAIAAAEPQPDMWKLWRLLNASEGGYRRLIAERLRGRDGLEQTQLFLAQELPYQLEKSPANFITRLDAPQNKAIRTTTGALDVCFRHPYRIDVDEVIRRREILIVDGNAGRVETDDVAVVMQFALVFIHNALLRQQQLPRGERARVALKVDEAPLGSFSHKFAELLALGRSSGLECVCAFQSPSQIPDPTLRANIFDLLQNWCVFASGEDAARELSALLQTVYADVQRDDLAARERQRISTDALINLPRFWFAASWLAAGARVNPFVAQTLPMGDPDPELADLHRARQRASGAHPLTPASLPVAYHSVGKETDDGLADEPSANGHHPAPSATESDDDVTGEPQSSAQPPPQPSAATRRVADAPLRPVARHAPAPSIGERALAEDAPTADATPVTLGAAPLPHAPHTVQPRPRTRPAAKPDPGAGANERPPVDAPASPAEAVTQSSSDRIPIRATVGQTRDAAQTTGEPPRARPRAGTPLTVSTPAGADAGTRASSPATPREPASIPAEALVALSELDLYARPRTLKWDVIERVGADQRREPTLREQAILAALVELRVLSSPQIQRRFMPDASERTVRNQLHAMCTQGWLRRAHLICEGPGQTPRLVCLDDDGFKVIRDARTRFRPFLVERDGWRKPEITDERRLPHDLHANAWYLAFERLAGHVVAGVRGPQSARLYPPSRPHPDYRHDAKRRLPLTPDEIADRTLGSGQRFDGLDPAAIAPVHPDLAIEVSLPKLARRPRQHYLLEIERSRHPAGLRDKLARYDALITAWARTQEPFLTGGLPPAVIFVFPDEPMALAVAKLADALVRGRIASLEDRQSAWPYPGRKRMFFASERDVHLGMLRALMLPELPAGVRRAAGSGGRAPFRPALRDIIRTDVLDAHRR